MTAPTYDISTIFGLARIPEDRLAACLAELPIALVHVRQMILAVEMFRAAQGLPDPTDQDLLATLRDGCNWIDDDLGNVNVNVTVADADGAALAEAAVHHNHKTGAFSATVNAGEQP